MRLLVAILLAHTLIGGAPPFPWQHYSQVPASQAVSACQGRAKLMQISGEWEVLYNESRDMFLHIGVRGPDYVYFARGNAVEDTITITKVLPLEKAQALYPDPCAYFTEVEAHK